MNWTELQKYYKGYDATGYVGTLNAEIHLLEKDKKEIELTPDQLRELAEIKEKLEYLYKIRN